IAKLETRAPFDLITAFDAIHDQADPAGVLRRIRAALGRDGTFLMLDVCASSELADNIGVPMAPYLYTMSTMHCMSVSLAAGGPGVVHVLVPKDVAALGRLPLLVPHASLVAPACPQILPQEIVSYAGQAVALVIAEGAAQAEDALEALRVEYQPLPAVASLDDALRAGGPRVHPGGNVASRFTQKVGDPASELARAPVVLRERFHLHRGAGMGMETRAIAARWDGDLGQG